MINRWEDNRIRVFPLISFPTLIKITLSTYLRKGKEIKLLRLRMVIKLRKKISKMKSRSPKGEERAKNEFFTFIDIILTLIIDID